MSDGKLPDAGEDRRRFSDRLDEADVLTRRFIDVRDGEKGTRTPGHQQPENWLEGDDDGLSGNYGVHPGHGLIEFDVDDYDDEHDTEKLDALPETFTVESPHTVDDAPGHRYYAVDDDEAVRDVLNAIAGTLNPEPSWGEVKYEGKYVVGPGSQLDGCTKEWCDECDESDGGYYRIAEDKPIATISADAIREVLLADPEFAPRGDGETKASDVFDLGDGDEGKTSEYNGDGWTEDEAREALSYISPSVGNDKWVRIGYALGSEFDDETAKDLYVEWSKGTLSEDHSGTEWDDEAERRAPDIIERSEPTDSANGNVATMGTVYRFAVDNGWDAPGRNKSNNTVGVDEREIPTPDSITGLTVNDGGYGEWIKKYDEDGEPYWVWDEYTNFQIEVKSFLRLNNETQINLVVWPQEGEEYEVTVDPTVFNEKREFKANICTGLTATFSGGEDELNKIKRFVGTQDAPNRTGTHHMGLHGDEWVTPQGVLTGDGWTDEPEYVYVKRDIGVERKWSLTPDDGAEFDNEEVARILELLPQTRDTERLLPALAWFYAAPLRPYIHDWTGQFNLLFVLGGTGAGKTTTLETMWNAFGMEGDPLTADDTKFTLLSTLGASNAVPMWFDEYKPSDMADYEVDRFWNELRKTTRGGVSQRGNADKTTTGYHLHAPSVVSGEERVAGSAEERRGIFTTFRKDTTEPHSTTVKRYNQLVGGDFETSDGEIETFGGYDLDQHALAYYHHVLNLDRDELRSVWRDCAEYVAQLLADHDVTGVDELVKQGLQTIKFGSTLYLQFAHEMGGEPPISTDDVANAILYVATRSQGGANRKSHLDSFFELVARAAHHDYLIEDEHYTFVNEGGSNEELRVNLATAHDKVTKYAREHDVAEDLLNSKDDYRERIRDAADSPDSYITAYSQPSPPINRAVGINFEHARDSLDDFEKSMFTEVSQIDEDTDLATIATPIQRLDGSGNPFHTITVEVAAIAQDVEGNGPVYKGVLRDRTGVVELIDWFGCTVCETLEEGGRYLLKDVKVSYDKEGAVQLEPVRNTTQVSEIQEGVGHLDLAGAGEGQEQLDAAADGGDEVTGTQPKILDALREEPKEIHSLATVAGQVNESPADTQDALDILAEKGRVIEHEDGYSLD